MADKEQGNQEQGMRQGDEPVDLMLAREIRNLDREIQPGRDLWPGIERNISQMPQRKGTLWPGNWMPYAVAASLIIAVSSLVVNLVGPGQPGAELVTANYAIDSMQKGYLKVRNPLVEQFAETNKSLSPDTLDDLYRNIEIIENARLEIEAQVRKNPEDPRLVEMLMRVHQQELELLKQDYLKYGHSM
ncbi:MAG: hypothetical protein ABGY96_21410 [bacterium]